MEKEVANLEKKKQIEKKSMQILRFLNLNRKSSNIVEQLGIILRLYKYVIQNIQPESLEKLENTSGSKEEEYLNNLYLALTNNPGLDVTNSILFKHLLYMKGFESYIVLSKSRTGAPHISNLVKVGKEFFYFDPSLERSIFEEQAINEDDLLFCCVALGREEYSKFYTPLQILPENLRKPPMPIPEGVSEESMPRSLIDSIGKIIPNEITKGNRYFEECAEEEKVSIFRISKKVLKTNKEDKKDKEERE